MRLTTSNRRRLVAPAAGHVASEHVANLLLCDVLEQLAEKAMLLPFGRRPIVEVFGVRYVLGGVCPMDLYDGDLWPMDDQAVASASGGCPIVDGRGAPVLRIHAGRLQNARGRDLGSALELVAYVVQGDATAAAGPLPRPPGRRSPRSTPVGTSMAAGPARAVST